MVLIRTFNKECLRICFVVNQWGKITVIHPRFLYQIFQKLTEI